ncbi:hybrid signal transduction histidine kinase M, partial [Tanacetum coccineum]
DLYLGQIYSTNAKEVWDELEETYSKSDGSIIFSMHFKIHSFTQSGMPLAEHYHKLNSQWRYIRSSILITDPIPDVKSAFATLFRDESYRNSNIHNFKSSSTAFVTRSNNDWSSNRKTQNRRPNRFVNTNLVCKNCNMTGHTIERCFELIGYPPWFKKNPKVNNPKVTINSVSTSSSGYTSSSHTLTSDEYKRLMSLLSSSASGLACDIQGNVADSRVIQHMTYTAMFLFNVIDASYLNITVSHPNGTIAKVFDSGLNSKVPGGDWLGHPADHVLSVLKDKLEINDMTASQLPSVVLSGLKNSLTKNFVLELNDTNSLNFFDNPRSNEPYDDERDKTSKDDGTKSSAGLNAEPESCPTNAKGSVDLSASTNGQPEDVDATSNDDKYNSEGEDFEQFGQFFGLDDLDPDSIANEENVRRSSRRTKLPSRLAILGSLCESLQEQVVTTLGNAKALWDHLKDLFHDNKDARAINLDNELRSIKIGKMTVNEYCTKIKSMANRLKNLDCQVSEKNLVIYAVNGLDSRFATLVEIIRHREPLPTFETVVTCYLLKGVKFNDDSGATTNFESSSSSPTVLMASNSSTNKDSPYTSHSPTDDTTGLCYFNISIAASRSGDLYPVTKPSTLPNAFVSTSSTTWHQCLGHPGDDVLRSLTSRHFISCNKEKSTHICHACQLGKHVKLPFRSLNSIVKQCFDIIHSDL